jgi:uncharacterized protein YdcH (DUF465 family)
MKRILDQNEKVDEVYSSLKKITNALRTIKKSDILIFTKAINKLKSKHIDITKLIDDLTELSEKVERADGCLDQMENDKVKRGEIEAQKDYSPLQAGEYIANKIGRDKAISKAQINNYIRDGKLKSFKKGNYNRIYQYDLDEFIEYHGDGIRNV